MEWYWWVVLGVVALIALAIGVLYYWGKMMSDTGG